MYNAYETSDEVVDPDDPDNPDNPDNPNPPSILRKTRDIVLVLDISGSMSGSRIDNTRTAAKTFVTDILSKSSTTRIALVTFESYVHRLLDLTSDANALCGAIDQLSATGVTNMYGGLQEAGYILDASTADKKAIVIMGDGYPNEGATASSGTVTVDDGSSIYFGNYPMAVYNILRGPDGDVGTSAVSMTLTD